MITQWFLLAALGGPDAESSAARQQLTELFWALFLLAAFVLVGLVWVGIIRRNLRREDDRIRQREAALDEYYRDLFENAHDILFTLDFEGRMFSLNTAGEQILGYSRQEAAGLEFKQLIAPPSLDAFLEAVQRLEKGSPSAHCEIELKAKAGRRVILRVNLRRQSLPGKPPRVYGVAWDTTERKAAEEALRESEQRLRRSLDERVQLGRDLHDGIIQSIYAVGLALQECRNQLPHDPTRSADRLSKAINDLNAVIRDVRNFIVGLEPEVLQDQPFDAALRSLAETMSLEHGARFSIDVDREAVGELQARQATHLLQIAREAMSNSLRHARASQTVVSLKRRSGIVQLEVCDDGIGFDAQARSSGGRGLRNIAARAVELKARSEITSRPGGGTRVCVEIPAGDLHESA